MAEERTDEATSSSQVNSDEATVEVNVKTLDSQIYPFRVNKNMPVSSFKEKVASAIGVPVGRQRLIFRGRVLKDEHLLSEYHVEDGHTLHLVERQPVPSQSSSGANAADNNGNNDNRGYDSSTGGSRGRVGQVSHSVVLRTFNIGGEQGEGIVPDLNRIIGEVLNSAGIGSQTTTAGATNVPSIPSATPGSEAEGMRGTANTHTHVRNQGQPGQGIFGFPFLPLSQPLQLSFTGATVAVPPQHMVIPDSLTTLLEFINQMELALSVNSGSQSSPPVGAPQRPDNASLNPRGLPTPETLSNVIRRAQQLLSVHAGAALSNIAGRLEREGSSTDLVVRDQIQAEAMQVGVAMQHLGALLLELGRTIMTLRMGNSPAELVLNTGPAVYISSSGPNPIMVQPFPFQASSLFGLSSASQSNAAIPGPLSPGDVARNINIHIHAGSRTNAGEGPRSQAPASGNGTRPTLPVRSIIAAVPARSPSESADHAFNVFYPHGSSHPTDPTSNPSQSGLPQRPGPTEHNESQPIMDGVVPETTLQSVSLPIDIDHLHSQNRSVGANMEGTLEDSDFQGSLRSSVGGDDGNRNLDQMEVDGDGGTGEIPGSLSAHVSESDGHQVPTNKDVGVSLSMTGSSSAASMGDISCSAPAEAVSSKSEVQSSEMSRVELASTSGPGSRKHQEPLGSDKIVPLGLGSGALEPKRRRQPKTQGKDVRMDLRSANQDEESLARGQQVLQSLVSCGDSNQNRVDNNEPSVQVPHAFRQIMDSLPLGGQSGTNGQFDPASMMSQVIQSPAMNNLIAGVSEQAGFGSPDALRGILERITQTPSIRNTLSQIAQQAGGQSQAQELGNTAPGLGMGQGGGLDLSRMLQQLMPVVSQALGGALTGTAPIEEIVTPRDIYDSRNSEIDLRGAVQSIELQEPPGNIFRGVVESASMSGEGNASEDLIEELCIDDELVNGYIEMLQRDVARRLQSESSSNGDGL